MYTIIYNTPFFDVLSPILGWQFADLGLEQLFMNLPIFLNLVGHTKSYCIVFLELKNPKENKLSLITHD